MKIQPIQSTTLWRLFLHSISINPQMKVYCAKPHTCIIDDL